MYIENPKIETALYNGIEENERKPFETVQRPGERESVSTAFTTVQPHRNVSNGERERQHHDDSNSNT